MWTSFVSLGSCGRRSAAPFLGPSWVGVPGCRGRWRPRSRGQQRPAHRCRARTRQTRSGMRGPTCRRSNSRWQAGRPSTPTAGCPTSLPLSNSPVFGSSWGTQPTTRSWQVTGSLARHPTELDPRSATIAEIAAIHPRQMRQSRAFLVEARFPRPNGQLALGHATPRARTLKSRPPTAPIQCLPVYRSCQGPPSRARSRAQARGLQTTRQQRVGTIQRP